MRENCPERDKICSAMSYYFFMRYVALLRGINVGGNTMIKMGELAALFESLGFSSVKTYINSGNIAFDVAKTAESKLVTKIEKALNERFGRAISVMIRDQSSIHEILAANPFAGQFESHKEMHVLFLKEEMPAEKVRELMAAAPPQERFTVRGTEIYCHLPMGVADSILGKSFIEKRLKISVTGRNWRTAETLAEL